MFVDQGIVSEIRQLLVHYLESKAMYALTDAFNKLIAYDIEPERPLCKPGKHIGQMVNRTRGLYRRQTTRLLVTRDVTVCAEGANFLRSV